MGLRVGVGVLCYWLFLDWLIVCCFGYDCLFVLLLLCLVGLILVNKGLFYDRVVWFAF